MNLKATFLIMFLLGLCLPAAFAQTGLLAELTASDGASGDQFGASVAIYGNTAVVGAPNATIGPNKGRGAAYIFQNSGSGWIQVAKLTSSDHYAGGFGASVAMNSNTIIVANPGNQSADVFVEPPSGWATATETAGLQYDSAGDSVAISTDGTMVVLGTQFGGTGEAYLFREPASGWASSSSPSVFFKPPKIGGCTGGAVSIFNDTVVTSSVNCQPFFTDSAYVYLIPKGTRQDVFPTAILGSGSFLLGDSTAINANTIILGDPLSQDVLVYVRPKGGWTTTNIPTARLSSSAGGNDTFMGRSAAFAGDFVVTGAPYYDVGQVEPGAVLGYKKPANGWADASQASVQVVGPLSENYCEFGGSISTSGGLVLVGAQFATVDRTSTRQGAAYLYGPKNTPVNVLAHRE